MNECAFDRGNECVALERKKCEGCRFRKTKEELMAGRQKFFARLPLLPRVERIHILETYYGVNKGW